MKSKLKKPQIISLIVILTVSFGISSIIFFMPQTTTTYPINPFISYYTKISYSQNNGGAVQSGTAITLVWLSGIINSTTVEISEMEIATYLTLPVNFSDFKTYQVNLITGATNDSNGNFLYWTLPYWNFINAQPNEILLPVSIGTYTSFITGEENKLVLQLVRNTKVAWFWNLENISVANFDKYSGALIEFKSRIGDKIDIYELQSTVGINLGIDLNYYGTMIFLFSLIPSLIVYSMNLILSLRKKPEIKKTTPRERAETKKMKQKISNGNKIMEEK